MKLATRLNSVLPSTNKDVIEAIRKISEVDGISSVDLNYPEHFAVYSVQEVKEVLNEVGLEVNGLAIRFREKFINGELGNSDEAISKEAFELCKQAADACEELGGGVLTLWLGFDGFDYPFQIDYQKVWNQVKNYITEIADHKPNIKISIEYKPYQERSFAFIDSIGSTMLMVKEVDRENVGVTVDYCHMLMKRENPAHGLSIAAARGKLFGVHLNDGYGVHDDGLMVGTVTLFQTIEFVYYLKKYNYDSAIYFDTFPVREEPLKEIKQNVETLYKINALIDDLGLDYIAEVVSKNDAIEANKLFLEFLNSQALQSK